MCQEERAALCRTSHLGHIIWRADISLHYRARTSLFANQKEHSASIPLSLGVVCAQSGWPGGWGCMGAADRCGGARAGAEEAAAGARQTKRGRGRAAFGSACVRPHPGGSSAQIQGFTQKLICMQQGLGEN
jgi:hypothetical protein